MWTGLNPHTERLEDVWERKKGWALEGAIIIGSYVTLLRSV